MSSTQTVTPTAQVPISASKSEPTQLNYYAEGEVAFYPGTASTFRRYFDRRDVNITDARGFEDQFDLDKHGFKFIKLPRGEQDITDAEKVKAQLYPEFISLIKQT
jgi:hypothetical protein